MLIVKNGGSSSVVNDFIEKYGYKIPEDYVKFLRIYNGGETPNTSIKTPNVSTDIRAFLGLGDVNYSLDNASVIDRNGIVYLPIAVDSFGNYFMLDVSCDLGVYFMDHEENGTLEGVADSFTKFLELCTSETIKENSKLSPKEREKIMIEKGKAANITEGLRKMWQEEYEKYSSLKQEEVMI